MTECRGTYYDGHTALSRSVQLLVDENELLIKGHEFERRYPIPTLRLSPPVGRINRVLYLPDGGRCDLADGLMCGDMESLLRPHGLSHFIHRWESSLKRATVALLVTVAVIWAFITFGIPVLAGQVTEMIPPTIELRTGEETLNLLNHALLKPSHLDAARQHHIEGLFTTILRDLGDDRPYQLLFYQSPSLGANALALPGGTVILTDDLVALAKSDEELIAVMAHEIGHIKHRHALRMVIQNTSAGFLVAALTGDLLSTTSLSAALPTMLVESKYSRDMERQADEYAIHYLTQKHISLNHFAAILNRLTQYHDGGASKERVDSWNLYLRTHPTTTERIQALHLTRRPTEITNSD
jgi:Zn-dependent protease with chaperone function